MKKYLYITLGALTFGLGTVGMFLPFLPTTVFYLLTGFFWVRSSDRLHRQFIESEKYKQYIEDPLLKKNITDQGMIRMFVMMLFVFAIPFMLTDSALLRIVLIIVYLAHLVGLTWHLRFRK
ncbi:YbaN family protein [Trichococcus sp.]|uniref:YbaN family protein n=1 Tax=Trichococcus sp. TaxID=1985464 RepID=UPI003C7BE554